MIEFDGLKVIMFLCILLGVVIGGWLGMLYGVSL
jgi:hypothetical protein